MLTASTTGSSACDDSLQELCLAEALGRCRIRGSLLTGEELLVAVRTWDELWPGCCAGPVIELLRQAGPACAEEPGSARESASNEDGRISV